MYWKCEPASMFLSSANMPYCLRPPKVRGVSSLHHSLVLTIDKHYLDILGDPHLVIPQGLERKCSLEDKMWKTARPHRAAVRQICWKYRRR